MTDNLERALQERLLARSEVSSRDLEALRLFARTLPTRRSIWQRPVLAWAAAGAAIALAAAVALPPLLGNVTGPGATPSPTPASSPIPSAPTPTIAPEPSQPAPTPELPGNVVRLRVGSGSVVDVVIDDPEGLIEGASAEQADQTMSVRWFDSIVEQGPSASSIRVLWVGYPIDETVQLEVSTLSAGVTGSAGHLVLHFVQKAPPAQSDAEGEDRVLILQLAAPIDPANVEVTFSR